MISIQVHETRGGNMQRFLLLALFAALAGCATTPEVTYNYYPAKSATTLVVTQTLDCNADKTAMLAVNTAQATTAFTADTSRGPYQLAIKSLDGAFADTDFSLKRSEDGRLQSINQSAMGQGEAVAKAAISAAVAAAAIGGAAPPVGAPQLKECVNLNSWGGGKPVALVYTKTVDLAAQGTGYLNLSDSSNDKGLYNLLQNKLPPVGVKISSGAPLVSAAQDHSHSGDEVVMLTLQDVEIVPIEFDASGSAFATSQIVIPVAGTHTLPIPKAKLFGSTKVALTLADSGAITSIEYGKTTGAAGPLNVVGAAATAAAPETTAAQAADVKAQADLIAQQQRLARCHAQPSLCQ